MQKLVSHGHSWMSIKQYTLAEIGVFLRVIVIKEEEERNDALSRNWMAHNLSYDGIQGVIKGFNHSSKKPVKSKERELEEQKKVQADWNKLRHKMTGLK